MSPSWMEDGRCAGMNPDPWFSEDPRSVAYAKSVCAQCPVRTDCLDYAVRERIHKGTWGGLSERERRTVRRKRVRRHGTRSRYSGGCRCDECRAANAAYIARGRVS